jgi:ribosomal protein S18 acetylase RimI-like enzyme
MYEIRIASQKDAKDLANLNLQFNGVQIDFEMVVESMKKSSELIAVGTYEDKVVGFATAQVFKSFCYESSQGEITEMFVEEVHRNNGIGSKLIEFLEDAMNKRGVKSVKILTGNDNQNALKAYKKAGYALENELMLSKRLKQNT